MGFSGWGTWAQCLWVVGSVVVVHGPSCSTACEIVPDQGVNYVQLSAEAGKRSSIGILTAGQGIQSKKGDVFTISVDVKGGPLEVSIIEYGSKKYLGATKQIFRATGKAGTRKVSFTVREPNTDSVRIAFKVKRGATAVISNVKVDMKTASAPEK